MPTSVDPGNKADQLTWNNSQSLTFGVILGNPHAYAHVGSGCTIRQMWDLAFWSYRQSSRSIGSAVNRRLGRATLSTSQHELSCQYLPPSLDSSCLPNRWTWEVSLLCACRRPLEPTPAAQNSSPLSFHSSCTYSMYLHIAIMTEDSSEARCRCETRVP